MKRPINLAWIPNTITMGNLVFGFLSIVYSASSHYPHHLQVAGLMIIFATVFDGFDGYVARTLKVSGNIGKQLDSLADLITFGVAPGFLAYHMFLKDLVFLSTQGSFNYGMLIAAIFPICAAYRLARFNLQSSPTFFQGLPSPVAAIVIALQPLVFQKINIPLIYSMLFFLGTALLMVSTIRYSKPQAVLLDRLRGIKLILSLILIAIAIIFLKQWAVVVILALYLLSGLVSFAIQLIQTIRI